MSETWIKFEPVMPRGGRKTDWWVVRSRTGKLILGEVKWSLLRDEYHFFPVEPSFGHDDLRDIAYFCEAETKKHKAETL